MASGIIELTRTGYGQMFGRIVWESVSNGTEANTSTVTAILQVSRKDSYVTTGTWRGNLKVGGTTENFAVYHDVSSGWFTLKTVTTTVSHNSDGSGSCYIYGTIQGPGGTSMEYTSTTGSETVTLDTIPRQAILISVANFNDEESPTITYSNPAGNSLTSLQACISLTGEKDDIAYRDISKTDTIYTFNLTEAERNVLRAATTNGNSRTVTFFVRSKIGSTLYNSTLSRTFTIKNPSPTINPTITDANDVTYGLTGDRSKLVKYYSNATIEIGANAVKQAAINSKNVTCGGKSLTDDGIINAIESNNFVFTATDSRGNTTTKTVTVPFVDYIKLTCGLDNNMPDGTGSMTVRATGNCFNGSFGAKSNSLNVYYRYKTADGSYGGWNTMTVTKNGNTYSATANLTGLDYQATYVFQAYAEDELAIIYSVEKTVKGTPVFDWSESDFNFNVPVSVGNLNLSGNNVAIDIPGVCADQRFTVFPLCKITETKNTAYNSATQGFFYFHRLNGLQGPHFLFVQADDWYGGAAQFNMSVLGDINYNSSLTAASGTGFRTCRFRYNSVLYGGIALYISNANFGHVSFIGRTVDNTITGIDIYRRDNSTVLNSEIYNSLVYDAGYFLNVNNKLYFDDGSLGLQSYPVNSIYISYSHTSPASLFGGTWTRITNTFLWATDSGGTIGGTGGEKSHTLTVNEMPSHSHNGKVNTATDGHYSGNYNEVKRYSEAITNTIIETQITNSVGGGAAHNNMPPYTQVSIWRRTA